MIRLAFDGRYLRNTVPSSDGKAMHLLATKPHLAVKMQVDPSGAFRDAKTMARDTALDTPLPSDYWMRIITQAIERATGKKLTMVRMRQLATRDLGQAVRRGQMISVEIDEEDAIRVLADGRQVART